jgi:hypothetical protein
MLRQKWQLGRSHRLVHVAARFVVPEILLLDALKLHSLAVDDGVHLDVSPKRLDVALQR